MTADETIGANVHQLMWQRRIRSAQMCEEMGISRSLLTRKMRGETAWFARDIARAAEVLDVDPGRLFEGATTPNLRVTDRLSAIVELAA